MIAILAISNDLLAQSQNPIEGSKVYPGKLDIGECKINLFTIGYRLSLTSGEPILYTNVKWEGKDHQSTCLSNESFEIFLSIGTDSVPRYIHAGGTANLTIGAGDNQWSTHPYSATVAWDKLITKNFGTTENLHYFNSEEAQAICNNGFVVKSIKIVTSNRKVYTFK